MARNLQSKLPASDTLRVYDINTPILEKFVQEAKASSSGASVEIADTVRDAAENSVCVTFLTSLSRASRAALPRSELSDEFVHE